MKDKLTCPKCGESTDKRTVVGTLMMCGAMKGFKGWTYPAGGCRKHGSAAERDAKDVRIAELKGLLWDACATLHKAHPGLRKRIEAALAGKEGGG